MERERLAREKEEEEKKKKEQMIKEEFSDTRGEWEKDKQEMKELESQRAAGKDSAKPPSEREKSPGQPPQGQGEPGMSPKEADLANSPKEDKELAKAPEDPAVKADAGAKAADQEVIAEKNDKVAA